MIQATQQEDRYAAYRPMAHFSPAKGWCNDPNGLLYAEGWYHLFYQYNPAQPIWDNISWGHARSRDLLHWEECGVALAPDALGMIFSGSMVIDEHNTAGFGPNAWIAVFTHHGADGRQCQSLAYSTDGGIKFNKYAGNPVLTDPSETNFRDPKVFWHAETGRWVMVVSAGSKVSFYASHTLREWTYLSALHEPDGYTMECPDLFPVAGQWALTYSIIIPEGVQPGMRYRIGHFDGQAFHALTPPALLDCGPDNYAAVTFHGTQKRVLGLGWMNHWSYAKALPECGFRGSMTLPREYGLSLDGHSLLTFPAEEIFPGFSSISLCPGIENTPLPKAPFLLRLKVGGDFQLALKNDAGCLLIGYDTRAGVVYAQRQGVCGDSFGGAPRRFEVKTASVLHSLCVFIDTTSLELFINQGEYALTMQYFCDAPLAYASLQENVSCL